MSIVSVCRKPFIVGMNGMHHVTAIATQECIDFALELVHPLMQITAIIMPRSELNAMC